MSLSLLAPLQWGIHMAWVASKTHSYLELEVSDPQNKGSQEAASWLCLILVSSCWTKGYLKS